MKIIVLFFLLFASQHSSTFGSEGTATNSIRFIENKGQWSEPIMYAASVPGGRIFLEQQNFTWKFSNISELHDHVSSNKTAPSGSIFRTHAFQTFFKGSNTNAILSAEDRYGSYYNYFIGNNRAEWKSNVAAYGAVRYSGLYNGIDMTVYSTGPHLKYDFIVHAHADPRSIEIEYPGLDSMKLMSGSLYLFTCVNTIIESAPVAYQQINGIRHVVSCIFELNGKTLSFAFPGGYDESRELVIDPALIFSTYSGSIADNWGYCATYDSAGNAYTGSAAFDDGYPVTLGAFQATWGAGPSSFGYTGDVVISKFTADGSSLVYSTYLGGNNQDIPHSLIVSGNGELIVFGTTGSDNFPVSLSAFDSTFAGGSYIIVDAAIEYAYGSDVFITRFTADGTGIVGSTLLGGSKNDGLNTGTLLTNYGDDSRGEVLTDNSGNVYIASCTNSSNLPVTAGVFQPIKNSKLDGFVAKLNPDLSSLTWCTYIGGAKEDCPYAMKIAPDNTLILCGGTESTDFPVTTGALNENYNGGIADGFVARISGDGSALINATYTGTGDYDQAYLLDCGADNSVYIAGQTEGAYPTTPGVYSNSGSSQFITKLNPGLSSIIYSTVFGDGDPHVNISLTAMTVDSCEQVYIAGWGGTYNFSGYVFDMPVTADAYQNTTDGSDFYFIVFSKDAVAMLYATYFGGAYSSDHVDGGSSRFDKNGTLYQAVCTGCGGISDFPTTPGVWSSTNNSFNCNLAVVKFSFDLCDSVIQQPGSAAFSATDTDICEKFCIDFFDSSANDPVQWLWLFPGAVPSSSTAQNPAGICYNVPGVYEVTLITTGPAGNDTVTFSNYITVFSTPPFPVINESGNVLTSNTAAAYQWQFNNASIPGATTQVYTAMQTGYYTVIVTDSNGCQNSTTIYVLLTGTDETISGSNVIVYPNPSDGNITVEAVEGMITSLEIINGLGQEVYSTHGNLLFQTSTFNIDFTVAPDGMYILILKNNKSEVGRTLLVIDR
jgi:PKD repeat protein